MKFRASQASDILEFILIGSLPGRFIVTLKRLNFDCVSANCIGCCEAATTWAFQISDCCMLQLFVHSGVMVYQYGVMQQNRISEYYRFSKTPYSGRLPMPSNTLVMKRYTSTYILKMLMSWPVNWQYGLRNDYTDILTRWHCSYWRNHQLGGSEDQCHLTTYSQL